VAGIAQRDEQVNRQTCVTAHGRRIRRPLLRKLRRLFARFPEKRATWPHDTIGVVAEISDAAGRAARALAGNSARPGRATRLSPMLPSPLPPGFRKAESDVADSSGAGLRGPCAVKMSWRIQIAQLAATMHSSDRNDRNRPIAHHGERGN